jgi:hypothetical protein
MTHMSDIYWIMGTYEKIICIYLIISIIISRISNYSVPIFNTEHLLAGQASRVVRAGYRGVWFIGTKL